MFLQKNAQKADQVRQEIVHMKLQVQKIGKMLRDLQSYGN
jgi:hypothetical protein